MDESMLHNRINFPLYAVCALSSNYVVVSGGGGSANTGVFNGFAICEIGYESSGYVVYEIQRHSTGDLAIMNATMSSMNNKKKIFLAAGSEAECNVYQIRLQPRQAEKTEAEGAEGLRHRNVGNGDLPKPEGSNPKGSAMPASEPYLSDLEFAIQNLLSVKTDFSLKDPSQNCVTITLDSRVLLTGGADGAIRLWNFPEMREKMSIQASKKEISDIDVTFDKKYISCVTKDGKCKLYSMNDGKLLFSLDLPPEDDGKYFYKKAKFGMIEDKRNVHRLFTVLNPKNYKQNKAYIQHWTGPSFELTKACPAGQLLSALAVSRCGRYLAIGSMTDGDVDIYISFSLQRLKRIEKAHKTFVTGLAFLPPVEDNEESVLADCDAAVVSISVDNQILVHHIDKTVGISAWLAVVLVVLVLLGTLIGCSYFDL